MLNKPNIIRIIAFTLAFAGALYYPVQRLLYYKCTKPQEYRFRVDGAKLNEANFEIRPNVSGRWQWVDYIFPRAEKADKLRLDLLPSEEPGAPKLHFVYYPMSRDLAKRTLPRVKNGKAELVIKCYPNGRWSIGDLLVDGQPVKEDKITGGDR